MIYKNTNGSDDFKVEYTLVIPKEECAGYQLSVEERNFLDELDEAYAEIEQFTNHADKYDYALAVSSGIITGFIDNEATKEIRPYQDNIDKILHFLT